MSDPTQEEEVVDNTETSTEESSVFAMSDEDLMNMDPSQFDDSVEEDAAQATDDSGADDQDPVQDAADAADDSEDGDGDQEDGEADSDDEDADAPAKADESEEGDDDEDTDDEDKDKDGEDESDADESEDGEKEDTTVDYKKEYERILAPFKANGKQLQVKNADEAIQLMQMGANYNKKMASLKPNLKLMKLLENNNLLDEGKLSYLVDLEKKDPEAVKKLVKDSGLDPLEINTDEESDYKPNTYTVHDREIELDTVLDEIQDTPSYSRMIDVVSNKWDSASKQVIAQSPQLLKVVNEHVASGIYDTISKEMESERLFGRLEGLSDIEAYRQVGDAIQARGGFDDLSQKDGDTSDAPKKVVKEAKPAPKKKAEDPKLKDKKRAASTTKAAGSAKKDKDFNPLSLSDDEFSKLVDENLM